MQPVRDGREKVWFGCNGYFLSAKVEVSVEHCIHQLTALTANLLWNGKPTYLRQKADQIIVCSQPCEPIEQLEGHARAVFQRDGRAAHLLANGHRPAGRTHPP